MLTKSDIRSDLHVSIPHLTLPDGSGINGECCVVIPDDPVAWKREMEKELEGNEQIFLTLSNNVSGEFTLVFGNYPNDEAIRSADSGFKECNHFGANISRETLRQIHDATKFLLEQTAEIPEQDTK